MTHVSSLKVHRPSGMDRFSPVHALVKLVLALLLVSVPRFAPAQEFRSTLSGTVTDPSGRIVPGAKVTATNNATGTFYAAQTTHDGTYYIPYIVPGTYTVKVEAQGFETAVQQNVLLVASETFNQNFQLKVGAIVEQVVVTTAPPLLEAATGSGGTILDEKLLENLPVAGNQVYMLLGTTPGTQFTQTTFGPTGFSGTRSWDVTNQYIIGGGVNPADTSGGFNQFTLNGTNVTQQTTYGAMGAGTWNVAPDLDAVQEVNVMTTEYDAQYGRTTGGTVNMVTKSGTNQFHGDVFEFYKDGSLFDANTIQNKVQYGLPTQQQVENEFGGSFGGPIKKNKLWFFSSFDGYRQSIYNTVSTNVPPAYLRPGYNGNTGVDFGLISTMDPGFTQGGQQVDPYVLYGDTLFEPGDSTNPSNPNNAECYTNGSPTGPPSSCGNAENQIGHPNAYLGGTVNPNTGQPGSLIPAAQLNNTAMLLLKGGYIPLPNIKGAENYVGGFGEPSNYFAVSPDLYSTDQPIIRVDYDTSDKTHWYSFFEWQTGSEYRTLNGFEGLEANGDINHIRENWAASQDMTHTFSPTFIGDFKLSFSRFAVQYPDGDLAAAQPATKIGLNITPPPVTPLKDFPEFNIDSAPGSNFTPPTLFGNMNDVEASTLINLDADFTKIKGAHSIHFGGGVGYSTYGNPINGSVANNANGTFTFNGEWTSYDPLNANCYQPSAFSGVGSACSGAFAPNGSGWADFLLGLPGSGAVNWNDSLFDYQPIWDVYAQDNWKVTQRLTLNIGLRYDVQIGLKERFDELPRGFCQTCVNPITSDGVYQSNVTNASNIAQWQAAGINTAPLSKVMGDIVVAGVNGEPREAYNTDWTNVAPRIGFGFALNPKTVIRGGWGLMFGGGLEGGSPVGFQQQTNYLASTSAGDDPNQGGASPGAASAGPYGLGTPFPASTAYPLGLEPPVGRVGQPLASVGSGGLTIDNPNRKIPKTQVFSFGFQRELPGQIVLDTRFAANYASRLRALLWYNGTVSYAQLQYAIAPGSDIYSKLVPNPYYGVFAMSFPGGCGQSPTIPALALLLPYSQYCGFQSAPPVGEYNDPIGRNWYNGLEVKLTKHAGHGLTFNLAYTYSKIINGDGYQNGYPYQDANEIHWLSTYDRTHVLAITGVWAMPVGRGQQFLTNAPRLVDYAIGGWSLGWTFAAQSGTPVQIDQGFDYSCKSFAPPGGTSDGEWLNPLLDTNVSGSCATVVPHIGGTGYTYNTTPNVTTQVRNPTVPDLDLSLQKSFKLTERFSFQLRGEAFNSLNSVLKTGPDTTPTDLPASTFHNLTTGYSYYTGFGTIAPFQLNFPRNLRVEGKFSF
jgi:Carboxypeptidase regulatory-like domain/TonB dependent receptor